MSYVTTGEETCVICDKPAAGLITRGRGYEPAGWCDDHQRFVIDIVRAGIIEREQIKEGWRELKQTGFLSIA